MKTKALIIGLTTICGLLFAAFVVFDSPASALSAQLYRLCYSSLACPKGVMGDLWKIAEGKRPGLALVVVNPDEKTFEGGKREGRSIYYLERTRSYCDLETGDVIFVPGHFETDFASIPTWASALFESDGLAFMEAALLHDWLYAIGTPGSEAERARADRLFRDQLKKSHVNVIRRNIMYFAVSQFGAESFGRSEEMRALDNVTAKTRIVPKPTHIPTPNIGPGCEDFEIVYGTSDTFEVLYRKYVPAEEVVEDNSEIF